MFVHRVNHPRWTPIHVTKSFPIFREDNWISHEIPSHFQFPSLYISYHKVSICCYICPMGEAMRKSNLTQEFNLIESEFLIPLWSVEVVKLYMITLFLVNFKFVDVGNLLLEKWYRQVGLNILQVYILWAKDLLCDLGKSISQVHGHVLLRNVIGYFMQLVILLHFLKHPLLWCIQHFFLKLDSSIR